MYALCTVDYNRQVELHVSMVQNMTEISNNNILYFYFLPYIGCYIIYHPYIVRSSDTGR